MTRIKKVFEGRVLLNEEDSGLALISDAIIDRTDGPDSGPFVQLHSWSEDGSKEHHKWLRSLSRKRVRITVEVLPPEAPKKKARR